MVRRRWLAPLAALLLVPCLPAPAAAQIGVVAGYNRDFIEDFEPAEGFSFTERSDGFHVGIFLNLDAGPVGFRPAVVYHQVSGLRAEAGEAFSHFDLELVELPLDVRLRLPVPFVRPYVLLGPVFTFPSSAIDGVDEQLEPRPVRAAVGAGLELDFGFRLWPEIRYSRGLGPLMGSAIPVGDVTLMGEGEPRLDTFTLRLGISF